MADITVTAAKVAAIKPEISEIIPMIANAAITAGAAVYQLSTGKAALADGSAAGTANVRGIALQSVGAGGVVDVLKRGPVAGFTFTQDYDAPIYLSDTDAGILADAAGTASPGPIGRVVAMTDASLTKVLWVDCGMNTVAA